jgi:hypothetical protein
MGQYPGKYKPGDIPLDLSFAAMAAGLRVFAKAMATSS